VSNITRLAWDETRQYELGVDRGVFYPKNSPGVVWNGLIAIQENQSDSNNTVYIDGTKIVRSRNSGYFSGSVQAYHYPESFYDNQMIPSRRQSFGMSYRVLDQNKYKIHIVYNMIVPPPDFNNKQSSGESFTWNFTTLPIKIQGAKASSHIIIDASTAYDNVIQQVEDLLYGSDSNDAYLPTPDEIFAIFEASSILVVVDNGDGTFTVTGPDDAIQMIDSVTFQIQWPSVVYADAVSYRISSL